MNRTRITDATLAVTVGVLIAVGNARPAIARTPEPTPIVEPPIAEVPELGVPQDVFPDPLPLDPLPTMLAETGAIASGDPLVYLGLVALPFGLIAVGVALWGFSLERRDRERARRVPS